MTRLWQPPLPPEYRGLRGGPPSLILVHFELVSVSRDGQPIGPPYRQWSRSWTKQAAQIFNATIKSTTETSVKDTGGTLQSINPTISPYQSWKATSAAAEATYGIILGTGSTAENRDDYVLATPIAEGTGTGQLTHLATNPYTPPVAITGGYRVTVDRQVNNNSGGPIVVAEIGLYTYTSLNVGGQTAYFCALRDVLASTYSIADGASAVARYKIDWLV